VCSTLQFLTITPTHVASLSLHDALPISNTGDIGGDFVAVGETDTGDLPQRGVGLLGGGGTNGGADASLLGRRQIGGTVLQGVHTFLQRGSGGLVGDLLSALADQLVKSRHVFPPFSRCRCFQRIFYPGNI